jgi:predicted methyltransferase
LIEPALCPGAVAVDATMGNGQDTLWLCGLVGERGRVYAFDVQREAVDRTRERLNAAGVLQRAALFCTGHERMAEMVAEPVDVVMFNLGWLPGAGHNVTTRTETTLKAVETALSLLKPDGLMTICVYPGHDEGKRELEALLKWAGSLDPKRYDALIKCYLNQPNDPPRMIAVKRKKTRQASEGR